MINTANADFVRAIIEIFGAITTLLLGIMFLIMTAKKKKSEKYLFFLLLSVSGSLLVNAGWYIYDGDMTSKGCILNWWCIFITFMLNPLMVFCARGYLGNIIKENGDKPKKILMNSSIIPEIVGMLIPISNIFYKWMYYFDGQNVYHRMFGWYVYIGVIELAVITLVSLVVVQRHSIPGQKRLTLYVFLISPSVGMALQSFNPGIPFVHLGLAIGTLAVLAGYLIDWLNRQKGKTDISEARKTFWMIESVFLVLILCISAAVISSIVSVKTMSNKESEQSSLSLAHMVSETVNGAISEPISVSRTMAQSPAIIDALSQKNLEGSSQEKEMLSFMKRIQKEYGYQMIFVASERSKAYYTYEGFSRYMNVVGDIKDAWYNKFKDRNVRYELNIDEDKDNDMSLAIFVNMEVRGQKNELLGVCGVAMSMDALLNMLSSYETKYNLSISLTNKKGLIQINTEKERIEKENLDTRYLSKRTAREFTYHRSLTKAVLTKYMDGLDWHLVVEDNNPDKINIIHLIAPSVIIYFIGIVFMLLFAVLFGIHEKKRNRDLQTSRDKAETDGLTNLKNRYAMEQYIEEIERNGFPEHFYYAMIDVNGLKSVNDTLGHMAGDELILGAVKCICDVFMKYGNVYRIGGDEFVAMCTCDDTEMEALIQELEKKTKKWRGHLVKELSVSIGVSSHSRYPEYSVWELAKEADRLMYQNKYDYYVRTGKKHR